MAGTEALGMLANFLARQGGDQKFLPGAQNVVMNGGGAQEPTTPGLFDRLGTTAKNNPNQLALAMALAGQAFDNTPMAQTATQLVQGKIMSDRLNQTRKRQESEQGFLTRALADALRGKVTPAEQPGPTSVKVGATPKGLNIGLDVTPPSGGGSALANMDQANPVATPGGGPAGPVGGIGQGGLANAALNPWDPRRYSLHW